jgi:hypothetical protein
MWLALTAIGALTVSPSSWVVRPDPAVAATATTVVTIGFDDDRPARRAADPAGAWDDGDLLRQ